MSSGQFNALLKRALPLWLQYPIYRYLWNPFRRSVWKALGLQTILPSGIRLHVRNHSDWVIYNEVIVRGEYDGVIRTTFDHYQLGRPLRIVDLGANIGFFSFRFIDLFLQRFGNSEKLEMTLVEGSPAVFAELERRVGDEPLVRDHVKLIHGLAGRRDGAAYIAQGYIHYGYGASPHRSWGAKRVSYVDLNRIFSDDSLDLLKCDIEGAELELIENYPALLRRTRAVVIEFHRYGGDVNNARERLQEYGFARVQLISAVPPYSVEFFTRE